MAQPSRPASPVDSLQFSGPNYGDMALNWTSRLLAKFNFQVFRRPHRAIEWCDFDTTPKIVRECCQNQLVQNWARKLPLLQKRSPAETSSRYLESVINEVEAKDKTPLNVIDFCAGGGGPTPIFERLINSRRREHDGKHPLQFLLTDIYPNIPAWEAHAKKSDNLTYIEESVDATQPPPSALSITTSSSTQPSTTSNTRIFRLFNLSFHHFPDPLAEQVLRSTLLNSDGFAIIELQDRRFGCLLTMLMNVFLVLAVTPFWFPLWRKKMHNLLTYTGVLPFVLCWDGVASCIRTRDFEEVMAIVGQIEGVEPKIEGKELGERLCEIKEWRFTARRELHTWPFGYVNFTTGVRKPKEQRLVE